MGWRFWDAVANKRATLARTLTATGAIKALEAIGRKPGSAVVLTYHRIADPNPSEPYYEPVISATPGGFRAQMAMVREHFRVVAPEDLLAKDDGSSDRRPRAVVTFDDGYRDNFDAALPILRELGVPATFFIPSGFLERPRLPWWDHVAHVVKSTALPRFSVARKPDDPEPIAIELDGPDRSPAVMRIIRAILDGQVPDRDAFLARLNEAAEVEVDSPALGRDLFMSWDHLAKLVAEGHTIGSHAHDHVELRSLDDRAARRELVLSRSILEAATKRPVRTLAYPYGWPGAVDARAYRLAASAGYRVGFTAVEGIVRPDAPGFDPLALPRLTVGTGDTPALLRSRAALWGAAGKSWL